METDISFSDVDLKPEKIEDIKDEGQKFHCDLSDKEMVHKVAMALLQGLSSACVDITTGDIFKSPGTVAADVRKEMLDYLTERSESFVAETFLSEGANGTEEEKSDHPYDILSDFIDDFLALKRNLLSRVSGWLLSEMREDKIDDFVQEMELNSFWLLDRREAIAQTLLKNVDFKNEFHCKMKFKAYEELEQHRLNCGFRTVMCENEGCSATFSAAHLKKHDSICPFKILPCEQKCPEILIRREMDKHCITTCPMKLINCPFYSIGCQATVPSSNIKEHCSEDVSSHVLYSLLYFYKGASAQDLKPRAAQIEQESLGRLAGTQGVRSFTNAVKAIDSKLGPFSVIKKQVDNGSEEPKVSDIEKKQEDKGEEPSKSDVEKPQENKGEEETKKSDVEKPQENKGEEEPKKSDVEKPQEVKGEEPIKSDIEKQENKDKEKPRNSDVEKKQDDKGNDEPRKSYVQMKQVDMGEEAKPSDVQKKQDDNGGEESERTDVEKKHDDKDEEPRKSDSEEQPAEQTGS